MKINIYVNLNINQGFCRPQNELVSSEMISVSLNAFYISFPRFLPAGQTFPISKRLPNQHAFTNGRETRDGIKKEDEETDTTGFIEKPVVAR